MVRILFVCLGNICRSPMAEYMLKDILEKKGELDNYYIDSVGTSDEEHGNPVYKGAKLKLAEHGINCDEKRARQFKKSDYNNYDYIITMEEIHIYQLERIIGSDNFKTIGEHKEISKAYRFVSNKIRDKKGKIHRLLDFSDNPRDISDPWYTGNFEEAYNDIKEGLDGFVKYLDSKK